MTYRFTGEWMYKGEVVPEPTEYPSYYWENGLYGGPVPVFVEASL